jgi:Cu(I)/Ag(I) efflux system membrane fusion protein
MNRGSGLVPALIVAIALIGCGEKQPAAENGQAGHSHGAGGPGEKNQRYQCSMHPNIVSDKPGTCPICGMDLQPVNTVQAKGITGRAAVQLTEQQRQLINIRTTPVKQEEVSRTVRTVGTVAYDQSKVAEITSRVTGWVEKLYVDKPGEQVEQGQPLMELYSPDLYSAAQDYLLASRAAKSAGRSGSGRYARSRSSGAEALLDSARKRLELFGITPAQIDKIEQAQSAKTAIPITTPISGTVVEKNVVQGQMIQPNTALYRIADLSQVWIEAEIYESELPLVQVGQEVKVTLPSYPDRSFTGKVDFIYPYLQGRTRTAKARVVLDNPEGILKPDMYANVEVEAGLGQELVIPASAVFDTGKRQYVFIQQEKGLFVPKEIELGPRVGDEVVVRAGLQPNQEGVVNGTFLLDSESQLKAAATGGAEVESAGPLEQPQRRAEELVTPLPAQAATVYRPLVDAYLQAKELLAQDTAEGLPAIGNRLRESADAIAKANIAPDKNVEVYRKRLAELEKALATFQALSLEEARVEFGNVSFALIALLSEFPPPLKLDLYVFKCPMWQKSPARWLQAQREIKNPFMGSAMLTCGELVSETTLEGVAR